MLSHVRHRIIEPHGRARKGAAPLFRQKIGGTMDAMITEGRTLRAEATRTGRIAAGRLCSLLCALAFATCLALAATSTTAWAADQAWTYNASNQTLTSTRTDGSTVTLSYVTANGSNLTIGNGWEQTIDHGFSGPLDLTGEIADAAGNAYAITYIEDYAFRDCTKLESVKLPESIEVIDYCAFRNCRSLTSIDLPESLTRIETAAFADCSSLSSVTIPSSMGAIGPAVFSGCSSLSSVTIPESVTSIGDYAFSKCSSLASINLPENLKSIGECAFENCTSLVSITIPKGLERIGGYMFNGCSSLASITVPGSVANIGAGMVRNCTSLESVTIEEGVGSIDASAFSGCTSLTSVAIPGSVKAIGTKAFYGCSSLASVTIAEGVASLGERAFEDCVKLSSVDLPKSLATIGNYAFHHCASLESISLPEGLTSIGECAFVECNALASVTFSEGLTSIGDYAFYECPSLTSVIIPGTVTHVGTEVFYHCASLTSVTFAEGVTSIGTSMFSKCPSLSSVSLPESLKSIGNSAFSECDALASITIPGSVESIGDGAFLACGSLRSPIICDGVKSIGAKAFAYSGLTSVTIPGSVERIGNSAFFNCLFLEKVAVMAKTPPDLGRAYGATFDECPETLVIVVSEESFANYNDVDGWSAYLNNLKPGYRLTVEGGIGSSLYLEGDEAKISVEASLSHAFVMWKLEGASFAAGSSESDEEATIVMGANDATATAVFHGIGGMPCPSSGFADVDPSEWYHEAVDWAVSNGIMEGFDENAGELAGLFGPDLALTRAQAAQILWNVEGKPVAERPAAFGDVSEDDWFAGAVAWAASEGIFKGYDDGSGLFGPDDALTREQAAAVLMRWAEFRGMSTSARADLSGYPDANGVSQWASECMSWAVAAGIIGGVGQPDGTFLLDAQGTSSRAMAAALMMNIIG